MRSNSNRAEDEIAERICSRGRVSVADALATGRDLIEAKGLASDWKAFLCRVGHERSAQRLMRAARWFDALDEKRQIVVSDKFQLSALYVISRKALRDELRERMFALAETAERVSDAACRALVPRPERASVVPPPRDEIFSKVKALAVDMAALNPDDRRAVLALYRKTFKKTLKNKPAERAKLSH
jgi:hypothetical protein